jgi:hypothetical protein
MVLKECSIFTLSSVMSATLSKHLRDLDDELKRKHAEINGEFMKEKII